VHAAKPTDFSIKTIQWIKQYRFCFKLIILKALYMVFDDKSKIIIATPIKP